MLFRSHFLIEPDREIHMRNDFTKPARLAAIMLASLCIPLPAQKEKQPPVEVIEATEVVELSVSGMT